MEPETRNWHVVCEEVLHEKNPKKLNALLKELLEALERHNRFGESDISVKPHY